MADEEGALAPTSDAPSDVEGIRAAIMADIAEQPEVEGTDATPTDSPAPAVDTTYRLPDGTEVTLSELEQGYLRQSDYTKKTQSLAQQRAEAEQALRLMQALADDPMGTLTALQENLIGPEDDLDPTEAQLRAHEERFAQLEQQRFEMELNQMLTSLEGEYADRGFDRDAVMEWAYQHEIPNLEAAFLHMEAKQAADAARAAGNQAALQRKQQVPPLGGRSRQLGGDAPVFREVKNVRDAMANALAELDL